MKISLVYPVGIFQNTDQIVYSHCIGLRSLSSVLKASGKHDVHFIDALMLGFDNVKPYANGFIAGLEPGNIVEHIHVDSELIGVSVPFSILSPVAHNIIEHIKGKFPRVPVVMGGVYPSTQPHLALTSLADFIVVGEGESAFMELADGKKSEEVQGVYSRSSREGEVYQAARAVKDLDSLPMPDYSIPMMDKYFDLSPRNKKGRTASLFTSRGCPFYCEFCSIHPVYGHKWRGRSANHVLNEIEYLVNTFDINNLEIEDDNFTQKKGRTIEILEGIIRLNERGAGLGWRTPNGLRIDTLDEEIIALMKKSNCESVTLAIEHGDEKMLSIMNKKLSLDKTYEVAKLLVKHEIPKIVIFLIVGYPGETHDRFLNSLEYIKKIKALGGEMEVIVNIAQAYPGTSLLARCRKEGYITDKDFDNFLKRKDMTSSRHYVSITTPDFNENEVLRRKRLLEKCFS